MADENQTDTTETQSSQTQANESAADGGADATKSGGDDNQGDDDASLLGGAKSADGDGGDKAADGDGDKGGEADQDKADDKDDSDKPEGPPETYDLKVTVKDEEGNEQPVEIDQQLLTEATPVLKEVGLNNEQASKVAALVPKVQARILQSQVDEFTSTKTAWAKEAQEDKEIGGANWKETEALAARALDTFGAPSQMKEVDGKMVETNPFRVLLNESGFGNHPETIRMFRRIGEAVGEDNKFVRSDAAAPSKKSQEEILYPDDVPTSKQGAK